jgi:SAM-dependent methyltransferase
MLKNIPFSYLWIFRRAMGDNFKSVLDLGCGGGEFMEKLKGSEKWSVTGVELFEESVKGAKEKEIYEKVVEGDVVELPRKKLEEGYDVVVSSQVIEHLRKKDGNKALRNWESLTRKRLVVSTPVGFIEYDPIEDKEENNPLQKHLSGWTPQELKEKGFIVRGQGARLIYGETGIARKLPKLFTFFSILGLVFAPFIYFLPNMATYMVAWKEK